jgi:hypothetical protein
MRGDPPPSVTTLHHPRRGRPLEGFARYCGVACGDCSGAMEIGADRRIRQIYPSRLTPLSDPSPAPVVVSAFHLGIVIILASSVGAKAKTPPFARGLRRTRCTNGDKTTGKLALRLIRRRTKTHDEVVSSRDGVRSGGPRVIRPILTGPAWPLRVTGLICKGLPVITVCNPALWEYSRDNLGV